MSIKELLAEAQTEATEDNPVICKAGGEVTEGAPRPENLRAIPPSEVRLGSGEVFGMAIVPKGKWSDDVTEAYEMGMLVVEVDPENKEIIQGFQKEGVEGDKLMDALKDSMKASLKEEFKEFLEYKRSKQAAGKPTLH